MVIRAIGSASSHSLQRLRGGGVSGRGNPLIPGAGLRGVLRHAEPLPIEISKQDHGAGLSGGRGLTIDAPARSLWPRRGRRGTGFRGSPSHPRLPSGPPQQVPESSGELCHADGHDPHLVARLCPTSVGTGVPCAAWSHKLQHRYGEPLFRKALLKELKFKRTHTRKTA